MSAADTPHPELFATRHTDPFLYGVCTCEPCWYERAAKREAAVAERLARREFWAALGRHVWDSEAMFGLLVVSGLAVVTLVIATLGNVVHVWLYQGGLPGVCR